MPPALAVIAIAAAAAAAVCIVAFVRIRRVMLAQRAALRGALDIAGVATLEDLIAAFDANRRRNDAVLALAPAVDEMVEKQAKLLASLRTRDTAGITAQNAMKAAGAEVSVASDAVGRLAHDVGVAGAAVEETVASISTVSSNIGGLADNVASVSSAIGELAVSVNQVAGNAQEASSRSVLADTKARDGGVAVERLVRSTREIADDISAVVAKMQELGAASERIGAIVEVIDAIADQTNLLALNAAIEAARAGEHGRGFAVVADEVRKLAESSAHSTREIGQLVKDIQAKTAEVVRSTTASGQKAETGLEMADLAGRAIGDISTAVAEANGLIEQISLAAREQAGGSSAIVNSVEQMDRLMREAAQSLNEQNTSNRQIISVIADIQGHARGVEDAMQRQRDAFAALVAESRALSAASNASRDAAAALDGVGEALCERVNAIAGTALAVHGPSTSGTYVSKSA